MANLREIFQDISENIDLGEFNIEEIPEVELPENFKDEFHQKYLTVVAAKNNPELMGHFKGKYLSSFDLKLKNGLTALGWTEEEIAELKGQEADSLKLVDLAFNQIKERKSKEQPKSNDKAFESYKKETAKQIQELQGIIEQSKGTYESELADVNSKWMGRFRDSKLNEILSGKKFDSSIPEDDIKILIKSKIANSNYDIRLQDDLTFKVFDKENPDVEVIKDGKNVHINDILDEFASVYTEKNRQTTETKPETRVVEVASAGGDNDGRFTPGHKDYGK